MYAIYGNIYIHLPSIYPSHVSIYTSTMDSMGMVKDGQMIHAPLFVATIHPNCLWVPWSNQRPTSPAAHPTGRGLLRQGGSCKDRQEPGL